MANWFAHACPEISYHGRLFQLLSAARELGIIDSQNGVKKNRKELQEFENVGGWVKFLWSVCLSVFLSFCLLSVQSLSTKQFTFHLGTFTKLPKKVCTWLHLPALLVPTCIPVLCSPAWVLLTYLPDLPDLPAPACIPVLCSPAWVLLTYLPDLPAPACILVLCSPAWFLVSCIMHTFSVAL